MLAPRDFSTSWKIYAEAFWYDLVALIFNVFRYLNKEILKIKRCLLGCLAQVSFPQIPCVLASTNNFSVVARGPPTALQL
jgi:hypothetical protein